MPLTNLYSKFSEVINDILSNKYIDISNETETELQLQVHQLIDTQKNFIDTQSLHLDYSEEYCMFIYDSNIDNNVITLENFLVDALNSTSFSQDTNYKNFNFIFIVNQLSTKLTIDSKINTNGFKKKILLQLQSTLNSTPLKMSDIEYKTIFISNQEQHDFEIRIKSRIRSLEITNSPLSESASFSGHVFSANLFDIVEIYNILGNELFDKNVRYGLDDELQVQYEIKKTLENNPQEFWYLNNGITMVLKDSDFKLNKSNSLHLRYGNTKVLYVINGAQTISAAADFFYSNPNTTTTIAAQSKAEVMLRIIKVNQENSSTDDAEIDKISISLNRQKPIKVEDIAFTIPFVYCINRLNQSHRDDFDFFRLIKRGEESLNVNEYNLVQFARVTKAYLAQQPGRAMSQGARTLLKPTYEDDVPSFSDTNIFKPDIISEQNTDPFILLKKYYSPVNLAIKLEKYYSNYAKKNTTHPTLEQAALNYGKWHFVAYMIYILNGKDATDFTNLHVDDSKLDTHIGECIKDYLTLFNQIISSNPSFSNLTSNSFKRNELYDYIINFESSSDVDIDSFSTKYNTLFK